MSYQFAKLGTNECTVANIQLAFWERAQRKFDEIARGSGKLTPARFAEESCLAIADAGTSVSVLLGQSCKALSDDWTERPKDLWAGLVEDENLAGFDVGQDLDVRFDDLIKRSEDIRHFGAPNKAVSIQDVTPEVLCRMMRTAQDVWKVVCGLCGQELPLEERDFQL